MMFAIEVTLSPLFGNFSDPLFQLRLLPLPGFPREQETRKPLSYALWNTSR